MKKQEFLKALEGCTIVIKQVNPFNWYQDTERAPTFEIKGVPEALKQLHKNQIIANLKEWCSEQKTEVPHELCDFYKKQWLKQENIVDLTGRDFVEGDSAKAYLEWCEEHPTLIFKF